MGETSKLKISIWKSYIPDATLILAPPATSTENESERSVRELSSDGVGLHKEVYSWRMADDPFGGVVSSERREALSVLLRDQLTIEIQPTERTIAKLRAFIEQAKADMDAGVEWSGSQSYFSEDEGHRLNPLLALTNHLEWLAEVFSEQPSISVTVR